MGFKGCGQRPKRLLSPRYNSGQALMIAPGRDKRVVRVLGGGKGRPLPGVKPNKQSSAESTLSDSEYGVVLLWDYMHPPFGGAIIASFHPPFGGRFGAPEVVIVLCSL